MAETFYDQWLRAGDIAQQAMRSSPAVARDRDIPWVSTPQDARVKLMVAQDLGFATMGSNVLKAEIPVGWHTGCHRHGEESMHVLQGDGFSIVAGRRFDWHAGTTLQIPFGAAHQHVNTGDVPALTVSGMAFDLERFVQLARVEQLAPCGPNDEATLAAAPAQQSQYHADGSRAAIHLEDAPTAIAFSDNAHLASVHNQHAFTQHLVVDKNGFRAISVAVTTRWEDPPYHHSGRHKHLEAVVYAIEGRGTTDMNGVDVAWEAGDVLYVPPAMWEHQHTNDSPEPVKQLRIAFGIRKWFTSIWPDGFTPQRIYDDAGNPVEAGANVAPVSRQGS